jgi:hypothetical protein
VLPNGKHKGTILSIVFVIPSNEKMKKMRQGTYHGKKRERGEALSKMNMG